MPTRIHTVCTHEHKAALSHKGSSHADSGTKTHEAPSCWAAVQQAQLAVANEPVVLGTGDGHLVPLERAVLDAEHGKLRPKHGRHGYLRANDEAGCCRVMSAGLPIRTSKIWNRDVTRAAIPRRKSSQTAWACVDFSSLRCTCCYCVRRCLYCGAVVCFVLLRTLLCSVACSVGWCHRSTHTRLEAALAEH